MSDRVHFLNINSLNMILFCQLTRFGQLAFFNFVPHFSLQMPSEAQGAYGVN